jgi:hypothetical protein
MSDLWLILYFVVLPAWCILALIVIMWRRQDQRYEEKQQLLAKHHELKGEGDECAWSVRLTAADQREALRLARVEIGLDEAPKPPKGWVDITHATSLGETGRVTVEAYEQVWKKKGWIIVPPGISSVPYVSRPNKPVPGTRYGTRYGALHESLLPQIANFNVPEATELDPDGPPTNLDEVLDRERSRQTWLGQF